MSTTRKFLFETSFDEIQRRREELVPPPEPEPEPLPEPEPPPEPVFSSAELLRAHEDGYADGFAAGKAAAEAAAATRLAAALGAVEGGLARLLGEASASTEAGRREMIGIALAISRKLLPSFARRHGLAEIEEMVAGCIGELVDEPRLVVRVADAMLDAVAEKVEAVAAARGFSGKVVMLADPGLEPGDCRVEWADGGVERDVGRLWRDIDGIAARLPDAGRAPAPAGD
jgi:flagellar assembly protein FliH